MESQEESNDPSDYSWTRIKGDDGEAGTDAYTIILGNENISFSVGYDSNVASSDQSYSSTVQIMQGVVERTDFTIGEISSANGITVTKNDEDKTIVLSVQKGDTITADSGYFRIPINIDGLIFYKDLTWSLARQGQPGDPGQSGEGAINVIVANESQTIACTSDGLVSENVLISIPFMAFKGLEKVPCSAVVGVLPSGITLGSNTPSITDEDGLIILNIAAKADLGGANILSGYINITFTVEERTVTKRFIWTKTKDGKDGNTYTLELSSVIVNKNYDGTLSPQSITLKAYYQDGTERVPYEGRFIIAESYFNDIYLTDESNNLLIDENNNLLFLSGSSGSVYENVYVSSENESEYTHTLSDTVSGLICYLCLADSVTNILDQQSVTVLTYIDDIKPIITEITTTMSGVSQKIDAVEKSITNKVWQSDITDAINNYDGTTIKTIRDQVAQIDISIHGITSEVSDVKSTLTTKADGSVVQELSEKVSKVEQDADGLRQTVEDNYVTNDGLDENSQTLRSEFNQTAGEISQTVTDLQGNISSMEQDLSGFKLEVESGYAKKENAVANTEVLYYLSNSTTELVGGIWSSVAPEWTNGKYMWSKVKTTYADGLSSESEPTCIAGARGQDGRDGDDGIGILSTAITYQASTSGTLPPDDGWSSSIPSVSAGQYLWTKTQINYTDDTNSISYSVSKIGADGQNGKNGTSVTILGSYDSEEELISEHPVGNVGDAYIINGALYVWNASQSKWENVGNIQGPAGNPGNGIQSTAVTYQASVSGTDIPTGTWSPTIPAVNDGEYLWTRTVTLYTDGTSSISYSIGKMGESGSDGTGVESITPEYYLSTSKTELIGGAWSSTPPQWEAGKYIWTRSKIVYQNPSSTSYTTPICDSSWEAAENVRSELNIRADEIEQRVEQKQDILPSNIRYIRDWLNGSDKGSENRWCDIQVIINDTNIESGQIDLAQGITATSDTSVSNITNYTDGDSGTYASSAISGWHYLQLDLGSDHTFDTGYIITKHYYEDNRKYNHRLEISSDGDTWYTLYDSSISGPYEETNNGRTYLIQDDLLSKDLAFIKLNVDSINMRVQENANNYSSISANVGSIIQRVESVESTTQDLQNTELPEFKENVQQQISEIKSESDSITMTVSKIQNDVSQQAQQIIEAGEWKVSLANIGAYDSSYATQTVNMSLTSNGLTISRSSSEGYRTQMTGDTINIQYDDGRGNFESVMSIERDLMYLTRIKVKNGIDHYTIKEIPIQYNLDGSSVGCLAFISSSGNS